MDVVRVPIPHNTIPPRFTELPCLMNGVCVVLLFFGGTLPSRCGGILVVIVVNVVLPSGVTGVELFPMVKNVCRYTPHGVV